MKIYLNKLTALKIIAAFFSTVIEMPGNVLIKKPGTFYYGRGCKKGLPRHLNLRKRNVEFTPDKTLASCAGFADRLVGKYRTLVAYNEFSRFELHKYWSKKIFNCRELNSFRIDLHYLFEGKVPKLLEYANGWMLLIQRFGKFFFSITTISLFLNWDRWQYTVLINIQIWKKML